MSQTFSGFDSPAVGTEVPLEMLSACHGRVERQCETLRRLQAHLPVHGSDEQARTAAVNIMRYFDTAAQDHHADEEEDLFPLLRQVATGADAASLNRLMAELLEEHQVLAQHWARVRAALQAIAAGSSSELDAGAVDALIALYDAHIAKEENELLPAAARLLSEVQLAQVGRAMRERRGIAAV